MKISVLIATNEQHGSVLACLELLVPQVQALSAEVIVAGHLSREVVETIEEGYPGAVVLPSHQATTLAVLRQTAFEASSGDVVAFIDPYTRVPAGWLSALAVSHKAHPHLAIGGPVRLHSSLQNSTSAWAVFLNEYATFQPPCRKGASVMLPGCNISFKRQAWDIARPETPPGGFWKALFTQALQQQGEELLLDPSLMVDLLKPAPFATYLRTRIDHGRCYAALRSAGEAKTVRALRAATAPVLPALFTARYMQAALGKPGARRHYLRTLPQQLLLFSAWAAGELIGYLVGPGPSCSRLYD